MFGSRADDIGPGYRLVQILHEARLKTPALQVSAGILQFLRRTIPQQDLANRRTDVQVGVC